MASLNSSSRMVEQNLGTLNQEVYESIFFWTQGKLLEDLAVSYPYAMNWLNPSDNFTDMEHMLQSGRPMKWVPSWNGTVPKNSRYYIVQAVIDVLFHRGFAGLDMLKVNISYTEGFNGTWTADERTSRLHMLNTIRTWIDPSLPPIKFSSEARGMLSFEGDQLTQATSLCASFVDPTLTATYTVKESRDTNKYYYDTRCNTIAETQLTQDEITFINDYRKKPKKGKGGTGTPLIVSGAKKACLGICWICKRQIYAFKVSTTANYNSDPNPEYKLEINQEHVIPPGIGNIIGTLVSTYLDTRTVVSANQAARASSGDPTNAKNLTSYGLLPSHALCNQSKSMISFIKIPDDSGTRRINVNYGKYTVHDVNIDDYVNRILNTDFATIYSGVQYDNSLHVEYTTRGDDFLNDIKVSIKTYMLRICNLLNYGDATFVQSTPPVRPDRDIIVITSKLKMILTYAFLAVKHLNQGDTQWYMPPTRVWRGGFNKSNKKNKKLYKRKTLKKKKIGGMYGKRGKAGYGSGGAYANTHKPAALPPPLPQNLFGPGGSFDKASNPSFKQPVSTGGSAAVSGGKGVGPPLPLPQNLFGLGGSFDKASNPSFKQPVSTGGSAAVSGGKGVGPPLPLSQNLFGPGGRGAAVSGGEGVGPPLPFPQKLVGTGGRGAAVSGGEGVGPPLPFPQKLVGTGGSFDKASNPSFKQPVSTGRGAAFLGSAAVSGGEGGLGEVELNGIIYKKCFDDVEPIELSSYKDGRSILLIKSFNFTNLDIFNIVFNSECNISPENNRYLIGKQEILLKLIKGDTQVVGSGGGAVSRRGNVPEGGGGYGTGGGGGYGTGGGGRGNGSRRGNVPGGGGGYGPGGGGGYGPGGGERGNGSGGGGRGNGSRRGNVPGGGGGYGPGGGERGNGSGGGGRGNGSRRGNGPGGGGRGNVPGGGGGYGPGGGRGNVPGGGGGYGPGGGAAFSGRSAENLKKEERTKRFSTVEAINKTKTAQFGSTPPRNPRGAIRTKNLILSRHITSSHRDEPSTGFSINANMLRSDLLFPMDKETTDLFLPKIPRTFIHILSKTDFTTAGTRFIFFIKFANFLDGRHSCPYIYVSNNEDEVAINKTELSNYYVCTGIFKMNDSITQFKTSLLNHPLLQKPILKLVIIRETYRSFNSYYFYVDDTTSNEDTLTISTGFIFSLHFYTPEENEIFLNIVNQMSIH